MRRDEMGEAQAYIDALIQCGLDDNMGNLASGAREYIDEAPDFIVDPQLFTRDGSPRRRLADGTYECADKAVAAKCLMRIASHVCPEDVEAKEIFATAIEELYPNEARVDSHVVTAALADYDTACLRAGVGLECADFIERVRKYYGEGLAYGEENFGADDLFVSEVCGFEGSGLGYFVANYPDFTAHQIKASGGDFGRNSWYSMAVAYTEDEMRALTAMSERVYAKGDMEDTRYIDVIMREYGHGRKEVEKADRDESIVDADDVSAIICGHMGDALTDYMSADSAMCKYHCAKACSLMEAHSRHGFAIDADEGRARVIDMVADGVSAEKVLDAVNSLCWEYFSARGDMNACETYVDDLWERYDQRVYGRLGAENAEAMDYASGLMARNALMLDVYDNIDGKSVEVSDTMAYHMLRDHIKFFCAHHGGDELLSRAMERPTWVSAAEALGDERGGDYAELRNAMFNARGDRLRHLAETMASVDVPDMEMFVPSNDYEMGD